MPSENAVQLRMFFDNIGIATLQADEDQVLRKECPTSFEAILVTCLTSDLILELVAVAGVLVRVKEALTRLLM